MNRRARFRQQKERVIPPALAGRRTARAARITGSAPAGRKVVKKALSALEIGGDLLVQFVGGEGAAEHLAVDEKGGGGIDVEFVRRARLGLLEGVEHLLIREAFVKRLLGEAGLLGDGKHGLERLLHHPILLLRKEGFDQREKFVVAGAARQHGGGGRERIEGKFPEDEAHLAGVDVFLLHLGVGGLVKMAAVRAGHRGVFDDGDRRVGLPLDLVAEGTRHQQVGHGHLPARGALSGRGPGRAPQVIAGAACGEDCDNRRGAEERMTARDGWVGFGILGHGPCYPRNGAGFRPVDRPSGSPKSISSKLAIFKRRMWQWQAALPRPPGHDCLMAAPNRPSAARRFSSVISERPAEMRSAASGSPGRSCGCSRRRSGACRSRSPPTACQPKKRFTRSRTTPERCWISIAVGPSTRSTSVPGSGVWRSAGRDHWIFSGSEWAAISAPTMSAQRLTSSVEAKPCLANASVSVLCRRSASGRGTDLPGLFMLQGSATSIGHDASRWDEAAKARVAARGPLRR